MFQILFEHITATQSDVAVCDYTMTYPQHEVRDVLKLMQGTIDAASLGQELFYLRYFGKNPELWNKLYRRSLIEENKIRFEVGHGEDLLFQLRLMPYVRRLCTVQATLYHYVQRKNSAAHGLNRVGGKDITILQKYLDGSMADYENERIADLTFSAVFTGFLFSAYCIGKKPDYFYGQIQEFRNWDRFDSFCRTISRSNALRALYQEGVISIRFYWFQKILFGICAYGADRVAALLLWICSKLIVLKKRRFLIGLYE